MKGKLIAIAAMILLFIPTYIAVGYYIAVQNAPVDINAVSKMVMTDFNGKSFSFEKSSAPITANIEDNMVAFFLDMNKAAKSEDSLPDPLKGTQCFSVSYMTYDKEAVYKYYFTQDPNEAYYIDAENNAYRITNDYAGKFILSSYAKCLYTASVEPVLTISNEILTPSKMIWRYMNYLGEYSTASEVDNSGNAVKTYKLVGGMFNLSFDTKPDYLTVKILQNGDEIFNDLYENIGQVNINENATINVTLTAKWYDSDKRKSNGEAIYNFYGEVQAQPKFYLGKTSISPGDFVVLTGMNVENKDDITFTSEPSIDFTPVFFKDGKYVRALIPISIYLKDVLAMGQNSTPDDVINYNFTVTISGISQTMTLNVTEKAFKRQTYEISADIVAAKRSPSVLEAFNKAMSPIYASQETIKYWDGLFIEAAKNNMIKTGFGIYRTISSTKDEYRHEGIDYIVNSTDTALAVNGGKVIYVGEQVLSGKTVVIDHGWGLKSTYCHLSAINVSEGTIVKKGDIIGTVGATGFTNGLILHYSLSVFNVSICPYALWDEGVVMTNFDENQ